MAIFTTGFDGTPGATLTTTNHGGTDFVAATGTATFATDQVMHGTTSAKHSGSGGTSCSQRWDVPGSDTTFQWRGYLRWATLPPPGEFQFMTITTTGDTAAVAARITVSGKLRLYDSVGAGAWISTNNVPAAQQIRVEVYGSTTGTARVAYYVGDSLTPVEDSGVISGAFGGGAALYRTRLLRSDSYTDASWIDSVEFRTGADAAAAFIGPVTLAAPTVTATPTAPTTPGGSNGQLVATWPAVPGAASYDVDLITGTVSSGATVEANTAALTYAWTGLTAGAYTVAVRAKA